MAIERRPLHKPFVAPGSNLGVRIADRAQHLVSVIAGFWGGQPDVASEIAEVEWRKQPLATRVAWRLPPPVRRSKRATEASHARQTGLCLFTETHLQGVGKYVRATLDRLGCRSERAGARC